VNERISNVLYTTVVFIAAVFLFYGDQFQLWETQLMGIGPDGAKNYYTLAYHIEHDASSWWFDGMNYPEGEHLSFTDNQPLVANVLRWFNFVFPVSANLHWLLPLILWGSYLIGALALSALISKTKIRPWFAALTSVGVVLLSPQLVRLSGHYSLAYGFVIPVLFLLVFNAWKKTSINSWLGVIALLFLVGFIHPYFSAMGSLFVFVFRLLEQLNSHQLKSVKAWVKTFAYSFGGILLFQIALTLSDPVTDRPTSPYGFLVYRATLSSIFMPVVQWYMNPLKAVLPFLFKQAAEGNFYIGIFAIVGSIWAFVAAFREGINSWYQSLSEIRKFALFAFIASIPLMLLSVGFPFVVGPLDKLLAYSGPLQQFRGIGRFSFVFFYAINLFVALEVGAYFKKDISKKGMSVAILFIGVLWYEAYSYKTHIIDYTGHGSTIMNGRFLDDAEIDPNEFQAIVPLPYFHTGSENYRTSDKQVNIAPALALSQRTGLPLTAVHMSRTSLSQTLHSLALNGELLTEPTLLSEINEKPLLLFVDQRVGLEGFQVQLIYHSKPFFKANGYELRKLSLDAYHNILQENETKAKLWKQDAVVLKRDSTSIKNLLYYQGFNASSSENTFEGQGSKTVQRSDWTELTPKYFSLKDSTVYELSFWFDASEQNTVNTQVWHSDFVDEEEVKFNLSEVGDHVRAIVGSWALVVIPIEDRGNNQSVKVTLHRDGKNLPITFDEVLLKPALLHVTKKGSLNINNRYYKSVSNK
jgi:hypothetical protein